MLQYKEKKSRKGYAGSVVSIVGYDQVIDRCFPYLLPRVGYGFGGFTAARLPFAGQVGCKGMYEQKSHKNRDRYDRYRKQQGRSWFHTGIFVCENTLICMPGVQQNVKSA